MSDERKYGPGDIPPGQGSRVFEEAARNAGPSHDSPLPSSSGGPGQRIPNPGEFWRKPVPGGIEVRVNVVGPDGVVATGPGGLQIRYTWPEWADYVPSPSAGGAMPLGRVVEAANRLNEARTQLRADRDVEPCAARTGSGQMCEHAAGHDGPHTSLGGSLQWDEEVTRGVSDSEARIIERAAQAAAMRRAEAETLDWCLGRLREVRDRVTPIEFQRLCTEAMLEKLTPRQRELCRVLELALDSTFGVR